MKYMTATQIKKDLDMECKRRDKIFNRTFQKACEEVLAPLVKRTIKIMEKHLRSHNV